MAGITAGGFRTTVNLDGRAVDLQQSNVTLSVGRHVGSRWGVILAVGAIVNGSATVAVHEGDVGAGGMASVSGSWLAVYERARRPYVAFSLTAGASTSTAVADDDRRRRLTAADLRAGVMAGKTFGRLVPFAAARAFGGPVYWRLGGQRVTGGDVHHYAIGAGFTLRLPSRLDLVAELMAVGEQSATAGVTYRF